jgi:hypothetical protein
MDARLASLGLGPWLLFRWDKNKLTATQCMEIASWANEESVLIMAFADDQNVYDFDPLNSSSSNRRR